MKTEEEFEIERAKYALDNIWVLQYNFGHIELIKKYFDIGVKTKNNL